MNHMPEGCRPACAPRFTPKQGQYLAFIHAYTLVIGRPPAEATCDRARTLPRRARRLARGASAARAGPRRPSGRHRRRHDRAHPSDALRRYLKALLAKERNLSFVNLQLLTFHQLAAKLYAEANGLNPPVLRDDLFLEEALRQIIRARHPGTAAFSGIEERAGGCAALWQSLRDLRDGLVQPDVALEALDRHLVGLCQRRLDRGRDARPAAARPATHRWGAASAGRNSSKPSARSRELAALTR